MHVSLVVHRCLLAEFVVCDTLRACPKDAQDCPLEYDKCLATLNCLRRDGNRC